MNQKNIVIAGINTGVGKSVVAAILTEALNAYYWKPVQCGKPSDKDFVESCLSNKNRTFDGMCLTTPCSPHLAARIENKKINEPVLPNCTGTLIIEGTGGILTPINEQSSWIDAAMKWDADWILVHHHYLGSLNHFFLTIEAMKKRKIALIGVIFNGEGDLETENMLLKRANTICIARLKWQKITKKKVQKLAKEWRTFF